MNRVELKKRVGNVGTLLIREKGYIAPVDVFMRLGLLSVKDYEAWRSGSVPYMEKVCGANLGQLSFIMSLLRENAAKGNLKPSFTAYHQWGNSGKRVLRFSKYGDQKIERAYATHQVLKAVLPSVSE
jgi:hypothetical protein